MNYSKFRSLEVEDVFLKMVIMVCLVIIYFGFPSSYITVRPKSFKKRKNLSELRCYFSY
jgi:hypothetical protein